MIQLNLENDNDIFTILKGLKELPYKESAELIKNVEWVIDDVNKHIAASQAEAENLKDKEQS